MTAHTPGPWKFSPHGSGYLVTRENVFVVGHGICGVIPSHAATEDQCEANARLISAAPEAVAFARKFLEWHDALLVYRATNQLPGFHERAREARAVIAKAEGH